MSKRGTGSRRILVLGGGIAGLAAAYYALKEAPAAEVVVLEASERFGGLIRTIHHDDFVLDAGPDGFLTRKSAARQLCRDLGIEDQLVPRRTGRRAVYVRRKGILHRLPASMRLFVPLFEAELLDSGILSPEGTHRVFQGPERRDGTGDESVARFFTRHFGEEMYRYIAEPLAAGIFAGDGDTLSMEANFPELPRLERDRGGPVIPALRELQATSATVDDDIFRGFTDGLETLTATILRDLHAHRGCRLESDTAITAISQHGDGTWTVAAADGRMFPADAVICALPAPEATALLSSLDGMLARDLAEIPYSRTTAVFLAYHTRDIPAPLDGTGYLVPRTEGTPILACTWCSRKWPGRAPEGTELLRVFITGDEEPVQAARQELAETLEVRVEPMFTETIHFSRAIPQYTLGHRERRSRINARVAQYPGLYLAGAAHEGVGIPDCIRTGRESAYAAVTAPTFAHITNPREETRL